MIFYIEPSDVTNLTTSNTSSTSIVANWYKPRYPNGVITKYELELTKPEAEKCTKLFVFHCVNCQRHCPTDLTSVQNKQVNTVFYFMHLPYICVETDLGKCITTVQNDKRRIRFKFTCQNTTVFNHPFVNNVASKRILGVPVL